MTLSIALFVVFATLVVILAFFGLAYPGTPHAEAPPAHTMAATPEPAPRPGAGASMHDLVIADLAERKAFGLAKYGTTLQAGNGRRSLVDAYQEVLDLAVYLRQRIAEDEAEAKQAPALARLVRAAISENRLEFKDPIDGTDDDLALIKAVEFFERRAK